ncbi:transmembrane protein 156 [Nothoprocta perdicaria]|uniref:transmembrane protein 156 n=1 Tax=Nothoprocta perdicaria TaxID=30464 RepID=UPI000E1BB105|nr:transmembrane protein 156 [Nothoprocta perdicaria]
MCLALRKSELFRLAIGIVTMFIVCLPEFFKVQEDNTVMISCRDSCSLNNITFPLCTFNKSCKSSLQQRRKNQTILLKAIVNHPNFQNISCMCQSSSREQQPPIMYSECESNRQRNVVPQEARAVKKIARAKGSLEMETEDLVYFYKYFNFTVLPENEDEHHTYYMLEVHINNSIIRERNAAAGHLNHSCLVAMAEDQNDCINVSPQLKSYVEYPMCMTKIVWLGMIPIVFVVTVSVVVYKIVQENKQNYYKQRAAAVSTTLSSSISRRAGRTISATKTRLFPVAENNKQRTRLTAETVEILSVIPEHEHCHVGASCAEVSDVAV